MTVYEDDIGNINDRECYFTYDAVPTMFIEHSVRKLCSEYGSQPVETKVPRGQCLHYKSSWHGQNDKVPSALDRLRFSYVTMSITLSKEPFHSFKYPI